MIQINNNQLFYNGKAYQFQYNILEAAVVGTKLLIVFHPNNADCSYNNIYCYTLQNKFLWRIGEPSKEIAGSGRFPYVGISIDGNKYGAIDFYGRRFFFDINTGHIFDKDIVR